ncbi:MAG TPA: phytanoyl-CoA dioxygenase family protein [Acidimicrobiia bacterium]|nr:phytanoyl-CoA dioxygenase family protein [Acidimicrobiia bacterium]
MGSPIDRFPDSRDADAIVDSLQEHGAVLVDRMVDESTVAAINREVDDAVAVAEPGMRTINPAIQAFFGPYTKHVSGLAAVSPTFANDVMTHPTYLAACDRVLLPLCSRYRLNLGHLIVRGPGAEAQIPHRDEDVWPHFPRPHPDIQLASILALVDFRPENGATCVVPGSHRWERARQPVPDEIVHAEVPAGGAVIYLGSTIHFAGTNSTVDEWRRGVHLSYTLGWLRTEENNSLAVPPRVARTLSPRAQELLGYAVHDAILDGGGYLGMVRMRDPLELLRDGSLEG